MVKLRAFYTKMPCICKLIVQLSGAIEFKLSKMCLKELLSAFCQEKAAVSNELRA
jgi:hypothetical protein